MITQFLKLLLSFCVMAALALSAAAAAQNGPPPELSITEMAEIEVKSFFLKWPSPGRPFLHEKN